MRNSTQSQDVLGDSASFARITPGPRQIAAAGTSCANDDIAANGFGESAIERNGDFAHLSVMAQEGAARANRARGIGRFLDAVLRPVLDRMRRTLADLKRRREEQATYRALAALDSHTLRDIGLDRSEIRSAAREIADRHRAGVLALHSARHGA